jgi:lipopolysaccharide transport system ATP-binding protein
MSRKVIKFENISKQYRLGTVGTGTISHDLNRWWKVNILGQEDPYLTIGSANTRNSKADSDYVWALRNINFEVEEGEVLGIIGKNGAGKSTLLKLLSRVTSPSTGQIRVSGRIASLLEVGTGFHSEMTGRENIFMNGAIMGMTKAEIRRKLDEIIDFSGVERYIDTPVKRYSSGMTVRLGFAVAAHLEPEILVVDEVLAVGDAEFQKKALGKLQNVSQTKGRTVLFVSHNMASMLNLCSKGLLLEDGEIAFRGSMKDTVDCYLESSVRSSSVEYSEKKFRNASSLRIQSIRLLDAQSLQPKSSFRMAEDIVVELKVVTDEPEENIGLNIRMNDSMNHAIAAWRTREIFTEPLSIKSELISRTCIKNLNVFDGQYNLSFTVIRNTEVVDYIENAVSFEIFPSEVGVFGKVVSKTYNLIYTPSEWNFSHK